MRLCRHSLSLSCLPSASRQRNRRLTQWTASRPPGETLDFVHETDEVDGAAGRDRCVVLPGARMLVGDSPGAEAPLARHVVWPCDGLCRLRRPDARIRPAPDRPVAATTSTDPASPSPAACHRPERHDDLEGDRRQQADRPTAPAQQNVKGQAASTLALSCSYSAWVMAPLSSRPLADVISSATLLGDSAATDLT